MVIEEGGEARTSSLCKLCYSAKLVQQGKQPLKSWEWMEVVEKKAHRGRPWNIFGSEPFLRGMLKFFHSQKGRCKKDPSGLCSRKKQEGKQGQWQQESLFEEVVEQVKRSVDTDWVPRQCAVPTPQ